MERIKRKERPDIHTSVSLPFDDVCRRLEMSDSILSVCKRLRSWVRLKIMVPLVQTMHKVDRQLQADQLGHLSCSQMTSVGPSDGSVLVVAPGLPVNLNELQARFGTSPLVQQRLHLESFLMLPRATMERQYIVLRIEGKVKRRKKFLKVDA